ncbi:hypothetical protein DUGA6_63210 [Duganella sp. HH105]|nr:hypothetical protein DUGA6_63210 [Duganella sp. HH105]
MVRQTVGALVQFRVTNRLVAKQQRNRLGAGLRLPLDQLVHRFLVRVVRRVHAPGMELVAFGRIQQLDIAGGQFRLFGQRPQHRHVMAGHALDGVGIEQLTGISEAHVQTAVALFERIHH